MLSAHRFPRFGLLGLVVLGSSLFVHAAGAGTLCTGLPPSTLQVLDLKTPAVGEARVPAEELERRSETGDLASQHTMMLSLSNVVTSFDIAHRIVPGADGEVCDAPTLVRMVFGSSQRFAVLARDAAEDRCVRQTMLDHEAAHTRALDEAVDQFIDRQQSNFARGMTALKQTPAPTAAMAKARWETGLRAMVTEAREQLFIDLRSTIREIDTPATLAALENACGGKIRELQQNIKHP